MSDCPLKVLGGLCLLFSADTFFNKLIKALYISVAKEISEISEIGTLYALSGVRTQQRASQRRGGQNLSWRRKAN